MFFLKQNVRKSEKKTFCAIHTYQIFVSLTMTTFFAWYLKSADINTTLGLKGNTETMRNETSMCKQPIQRRAHSNRLQKHTRPVTDTLNSHTITNTWP